MANYGNDFPVTNGDPYFEAWKDQHFSKLSMTVDHQEIYTFYDPY